MAQPKNPVQTGDVRALTNLSIILAFFKAKFIL
jgi:hypothetical protein